MDEALRIIAEGGAALAIVASGVYAALRLLRQDKGWKDLLNAEKAENAELRAEITDLKARLDREE